MKTTLRLAALALLLSTINPQLSTLHAQGTAFTYQGRLDSSGAAANGSYDLLFAIYDAGSGGTQKGSTLSTNAVAVTNGYFMVTLDFGNVFPGNARWLDISVKTNGAVSYTALTPRQPLTPAPYAIMAGSASNVLGALPAAQLSGTVGNGQLANSSITVSAGPGLSGGGLIALGGATTLNNVGVLSVTGNADITASPTTGNVGLGSTATDVNTASRIVKRNASGNFSAGSVTLAGNLNLPATSVSAGVINSGGIRLLHAYGSGNSFVGPNAGNLTMTGMGNSANGYQALFNNTSGNMNTASGYQALFSNTSGYYNTASGYRALFSNTNGNYNTAAGELALNNNTSGSENTAVGDIALYSNTTGIRNTAVGNEALRYNSSGNYNIALGNLAGNSITTGSYNIDIGNQGLSSDNNIIRIGDSQTQTFIAGVINGNGGGLTNLNASQLTGGGDLLAARLKIGSGHLLTGYASTIAGGVGGANQADYSAIGGGLYNTIQTGAAYATLGGGYYNTIQPNAQYATLGGGDHNTIQTNADYATLGGGLNNTIQPNTYSATIGGGVFNTIQPNAYCATIPGGRNNSATNYAFAAGCRAKANHTGAFVWADSSNFDFEPYAMSQGGFANSFNVRATGGIYFVTGVDGTGYQNAGPYCAAGGGAFIAFSDRNGKANFAATDGREILARVVAMPIETWNYKAQDISIRHMGPMAQDFKAAFGLGETDKGINTIDADGVALAAIQGLNEKVEIRSQESEARSQNAEVSIRKLEAENAELKDKHQSLEARLERLEQLVIANHGGGK